MANRLALVVVDDVAVVDASVRCHVLHCGSIFRRLERHVNVEVVSMGQSLVTIYVLIIFTFGFGRHPFLFDDSGVGERLLVGSGGLRPHLCLVLLPPVSLNLVVVDARDLRTNHILVDFVDQAELVEPGFVLVPHKNVIHDYLIDLVAFDHVGEPASS